MLSVVEYFYSSAYARSFDSLNYSSSLMYVPRGTLANFFSVTIAAPANVTYVAPTRPSPTSSFRSTSDLVLTTPASTSSAANVTVAGSSSLSGGAIGGISIAGVAGAVLVCLGV